MNDELYCVVSYHSNDDPGTNLTGPISWAEAQEYWLRATNNGQRFVLKTHGCWIMKKKASEAPPYIEPQPNKLKKARKLK